jgi:hypothetical protein
MCNVMVRAGRLDGVRPGRNCPAGKEVCESLMLGTLKRSATRADLWPFSKEYPLSLAALAAKFRRVDVQSLCELPEFQGNRATKSKSHGIKEGIETDLIYLEKRPEIVKGLNLKDFELLQ